MVAGLLAACDAPVPPSAPPAPDPGSFDEAKADASKRAAYLEKLLAPLVYDEKANPKGLVQGWYTVPDQKHQPANCRCHGCAREALRAYYKEDGREFYFEREVGDILKSVEPLSSRVVPYFRRGEGIGTEARAGILLVGDLFSLSGEDEVRSLLEDFATPYARYADAGLKIGDRWIDMGVPALDAVGHSIILPYVAQAGQVEKILKQERKVSEPFRQDAIKGYLATAAAFGKEQAKQIKIYNDNNENTLQKEIVDQLDFLHKGILKRFEAAGFRHKLVDPKTFAVELEPAKP
jgi:hypothetical protein